VVWSEGACVGGGPGCCYWLQEYQVTWRYSPCLRGTSGSKVQVIPTQCGIFFLCRFQGFMPHLCPIYATFASFMPQICHFPKVAYATFGNDDIYATFRIDHSFQGSRALGLLVTGWGAGGHTSMHTIPEDPQPLHWKVMKFPPTSSPSIYILLSDGKYKSHGIF